ncbi:MAG: ribosome silencing factor [Lachnospiraceae bacterium]|nr:ribosome silencing factor [Lachnospiraceae bacterium]
MTNITEAVSTVVNALNEKKALDIKVIDISKISIMADYFIIASGTNINQIQAMSDNIQEKMSKINYSPKQIEGYDSANWILLDYIDIVIHIFDKESRAFYNLEHIWSDGTQITSF